MNFLFDSFGEFEVPNISLANPDLSLLFSLGNIHERELRLRYNALSEFSFVADQYQDNILNAYYEYLEYRRVVSIDGFGNFMITTIDEEGDGLNQKKVITCQSLETELNFKKISVFSGTYKFYDYVESNIEKTLLGQILLRAPGWSIGGVDASLYSVSRTFDISDNTIYSFMMNDVSQAYQCIFSFDTINRLIYVHDIPNATTESDIYMSYNNLISSIKVKEITDELVTALNVYGGGNLDIHLVNPLGTSTIYNFDYYKNATWMSQGLINALTIWEGNVSASQVVYAGLLTSLRISASALLVLQAEEQVLRTAPVIFSDSGSIVSGGLDPLKEIQVVRLANHDTPGYNEVTALIVQKEHEISLKQTQEKDKQTEKDGFNAQLKVIHDNLSFENNFSGSMVELERFVIGSTYTNPNFVMYDNMNDYQIQDEAQGLYNQAKGYYNDAGAYVQGVLDKVSQPRYTFEVDSVNFVLLQEFQKFIDQLALGVEITMELDDERTIYPVLLGIDISYDYPDQSKLIFSNRLRLDNSAFQLSDLLNQALNSGVSTTFNSDLWSSWSNNYKDEVSNFITSALNASLNNIINANNQNVVMDSTGIKIRYQDPTSGNYKPEQLWLTANMMAFTKDNWQSVSTALGQIQVPTGGSAYGLVADVIVGRLVAGNELLITNENSSFIVSGDHATLSNADFTISNPLNKITLSPIEGISISRDVGGGTTGDNGYEPNYSEKNFYLDTLGNIVFSGSLMGASGTFSGAINAKLGNIGTWRISDQGLEDDIHGYYIRGNGDMHVGLLTLDEASHTATFDGNIYARNLVDKVDGTQIKNIIADTITSGVIRGIDIYGSRIMWPGVTMYSPEPGASAIEGLSNITMVVPGALMGVYPNLALIQAPSVEIGGVQFAETWIKGKIKTVDDNFNKGIGKTASFQIGAYTLNFVNGLLVDPLSSGSIPPLVYKYGSRWYTDQGFGKWFYRIIDMTASPEVHWFDHYFNTYFTLINPVYPYNLIIAFDVSLVQNMSDPVGFGINCRIVPYPGSDITSIGYAQVVVSNDGESWSLGSTHRAFRWDWVEFKMATGDVRPWKYVGLQFRDMYPFGWQNVQIAFAYLENLAGSI